MFTREAESEFVAARNSRQQAEWASRRTSYLAAAIGFATLCAILTLLGAWLLAISALFIALICASNYFAANGHLHRIRKRGSRQKRLARDLSKLEPDRPAGPGSPDPRPGGVPT